MKTVFPSVTLSLQILLYCFGRILSVGTAEYTKDLQIYLRDEKDKIRFIYLKKPEKTEKKRKQKIDTHFTATS